MVFDPFDSVSHELLLHLLPFGAGYLCDEEGDPCSHSVRIMLTLQAIIAIQYQNQIKNIANEIN